MFARSATACAVRNANDAIPCTKRNARVRLRGWRYVIVNVQAARRYGMHSEAVDYTGRGRSPNHGIIIIIIIDYSHMPIRHKKKRRKEI